MTQKRNGARAEAHRVSDNQATATTAAVGSPDPRHRAVLLEVDALTDDPHSNMTRQRRFTRRYAKNFVATCDAGLLPRGPTPIPQPDHENAQSIDAIIRLVERTKASEPDVHIIVNAGATDPSSSRSLFTGMRKSLHHYMVNVQKVTRTGSRSRWRACRGTRAASPTRQVLDQQTNLACGSHVPATLRAVDQLVESAIKAFGLERFSMAMRTPRAAKREVKAAAAASLGSSELELEPGVGDLEPYPIVPCPERAHPRQLAAAGSELRRRAGGGGGAEREGTPWRATCPAGRALIRTSRPTGTGVSLHELYAGLKRRYPSFTERPRAGRRYGRSLTGVIFRCDFARSTMPSADASAQGRPLQFEYKIRATERHSVDAAYNMH